MEINNNFKFMSSKTNIKIDPLKGSFGGVQLGDSINKVLSYIQLNSQIFGKIEIISQKDDGTYPVFVILPDSGKILIFIGWFLININLGFKLKFDPKFQLLQQVEIYIQQSDLSKNIVYTMRGQVLSKGLMNYSLLS